MDTVFSPANQDCVLIWNVRVCQIQLAMVFQENHYFCFNTLHYFTFINYADASQSSINNEHFGLEENINLPENILHKATQTDRIQAVQCFTIEEVDNNEIWKKAVVRSK